MTHMLCLILPIRNEKGCSTTQVWDEVTLITISLFFPSRVLWSNSCYGKQLKDEKSCITKYSAATWSDEYGIRLYRERIACHGQRYIVQMSQVQCICCQSSVACVHFGNVARIFTPLLYFDGPVGQVVD